MKHSTLAAIRRQMNLRQPEFADLLGLQPETISRYENARLIIPPHVALAVIAVRAGLSDPETERREKL